ncbi:MAG: AraC family transcriptional regulator, partial [Oscillospiraceae bacterium]
MLTQAGATGDVVLTNTHSYFYQIYRNNETAMDLMYKNPNEIDKYKISQFMKEMIATNILAESVYVFNFEDNMAYSSLSSQMKIDDFFDKSVLDIIKTSKAGVVLNYPRTIDFKLNDGKPIKTKWITLIYKESPNAAFVVNLSAEKFESMVSQNIPYSGQQTIVLNNKKLAVISPDESFPLDMKDVDYVNKIADLPESKGTITANLNGKKHINFVKSQTMDFTYLMISDYGKAAPLSSNLFMLILLSGLFSLIMCLLSAGFFSWKSYLPVSELKDVAVGYLHKDSACSNDMNDLSLISDAFKAINSDIKALESSQFTNAKKNEYLREILNGNFVFFESYVDELLEKFDIKLREKESLVIVFELNKYNNILENNASDIPVLKYAILNIGTEIFGRNMNAGALAEGDDSVVFILNSKELKLDLIDKSIKEIQFYMNEYFKVTVTAGVGTLVNTLEDITISLRYAKHALLYRISSGDNSIIYYDEIINVEKADIPYPKELESSILCAVNVGNSGDVEEMLTQFMDIIKQLSYDKIVLYITTLWIEIEKLIKKNEMDENKININLEIQHCESLDSLNKFILKRCENIINTKNQSKNNKQDETISFVKKFIIENLNEPNFSVNLIAEEVDFSANHLRNIFKSTTGQSLSDYIMEKRFENIYNLLITTDISAREIGKMSGYNSETYFYTAFKKQCGYTPMEYRSIYQKKDKS